MSSTMGEILEGGDLGGEELAGEEHTQAEAPEELSLDREEPEQVETSDATTAQEETPDQPEEKSTDEDAEDPHPVPRAALIDERRKRQDAQKHSQELQTQLAEMRGQISAMMQTKQTGEEDVDHTEAFFKDPTGFMEKRDKQLIDNMQRQFVAMSRSDMMAQHDDYTEVEAVFDEAVKANPALWQEMWASGNPARFAYNSGKQLMQVQQHGSIGNMEKSIEARLRAEIEAEYKEKGAIDSAKKATKSSAATGGTGSKTSPVFSGPTPLGDIFGG